MKIVRVKKSEKCLNEKVWKMSVKKSKKMSEYKSKKSLKNVRVKKSGKK